jgi:hypothetical protein
VKDAFIANHKEERVMRLVVLIVVAIACATGLTAVMGFQQGSQPQEEAKSKPRPSPTYNPYPLGILPAGLNSEINRALREIDLIEGQERSGKEHCQAFHDSTTAITQEIRRAFNGQVS